MVKTLTNNKIMKKEKKDTIFILAINKQEEEIIKSIKVASIHSGLSIKEYLFKLHSKHE